MLFEIIFMMTFFLVIKLFYARIKSFKLFKFISILILDNNYKGQYLKH